MPKPQAASQNDWTHLVNKIAMVWCLAMAVHDLRSTSPVRRHVLLRVLA